MENWQTFIEKVREIHGIKKIKPCEQITLDYTKAELKVMYEGGKIDRIPNIIHDKK